MQLVTYYLAQYQLFVKILNEKHKKNDITVIFCGKI